MTGFTRWITPAGDYATLFYIHQSDEQVSVSGDPDRPFGSDSFYEIYVPCNCIRLAQDPYYPNQQGLTFWYGSPENIVNLRLTIYKRPDGDLKIWPCFPFPEDHIH